MSQTSKLRCCMREELCTNSIKIPCEIQSADAVEKAPVFFALKILKISKNNTKYNTA